MSAISDNLIHFLGRQYKESPNKQFDIFKSIINRGLRCGRINIKFGESGVIYNQATCFTDIPLSMCDEHANTYGKFGIGFKKSFVKQRGGNPARYFINYLPSETLDKSVIENRGLIYAYQCEQFKVLKYINDTVNKDGNFALYDSVGKIVFNNDALKRWALREITILSFEKETGDLGPPRDETKEIDLYYKEREWRLVPTQENIVAGFVEMDENKLAYYKFNRNHVNVVVTPNDEMRTDVIKYLLSLSKDEDERLHEFSENPLPVITYDDLYKW